MPEQPVLERRVCDFIRKQYPDFRGRMDRAEKVLAGEVQVLGPMDPCERCGTPIVPMERPTGRGWWHLRDCTPRGTGWYVRWRQHTPERCASIAAVAQAETGEADTDGLR